MNIRKYFLALFMLMMALTSLTPLSHARTSVVTPPAIEDFYVTPEDHITVGTELTFIIEGTPRAKATVRLSGIKRTIVLQETEAGVYEGSYTISNRDRLTPRMTMQATLRARNASTVMSRPLYSSGANVDAGASGGPVAIPIRQATMLVIDRFSSSPINKIEPGADLKFILNGTPGGKATFTIEGVTKDVPMQETRSGQYEGIYTIRRLDQFPANTSITGTLEVNGQAVRTRLNQPLVADAKPPVIKNVSPREGETVSGNLVLVSATFDDIGGVGVDAKNTRVLIDGNDVSRNATITPQFFNFRADLNPGRHSAEVLVKDLSGNTVRQAWGFTVAQQAGPTTLPLTITSHTNNTKVGSGTVEVRGRTARDARVDVKVQSVAAVAGMFGLTQQLFDQSLRADGNGNFAFSFQPQVSMPGSRYEVNISASKDNLQNDLKLVLFQ